jgi:hypothetical protein
MCPIRADIRGSLVTPNQWRDLAVSLVRSAEVLWTMPDNSGSHLQSAALLAGFGIENMLKSVRIKQKLKVGERITVKGQLARELSTHDLLELADRCGFRPERHEQFLLKRLTSVIIWEGRYVAPQKIGPVDVYGMSSTDRDNVRRLMWRLGELYDSVDASAPGSP